MTSILTSTRALALDVRHIDTGALLGVALVVPSEHHLSILDGAGRTVEPRLSAHVWREIDAWAAAGDAGLPARPAPMSPAILATLLEGARLSVSAQRFASIPISVASHAELAPLAERLLPELLNVRRSAA
jgi:hypothetical protein